MGATAGLLLAGGTGAVTSAFGAATQASAIRQRVRAQRQALQANADLARLQQIDIVRRGGRVSRQILQQTKNLIGQQRVAFAAQGVEVSSGTPADIQADTAALGALDAMTIRNNAFRQAFGFQLQEIGFRQQARLTEIGAQAAARATLLTGALGIARQAALTGAFISATRAPQATGGA